MSRGRAAELAEAERDTHWNRDKLEPAVAPGSAEESSALAAIDEAREDELAQLGDSPRTRRARHSRYWRRHFGRGGF